MEIRYEIEKETNAVKVFYDNLDYPSLYQPDYPSGQPWINEEEAAAWAELYIASVIDESAPYAPSSRGEAGHPKPTSQQKAALALMDSAKTPEEHAAAQDALKKAYESI